MPSSFVTAPAEIPKLAHGLMKKQHQDLLEADATITFLFATNQDGPPITHNGWPALALAKITSLRDRVAGLADALIVIDAEQWEDWTEEKRIAILDHELHHLEVRRNKAGAVKYDDANRPKLRIRPHDFQFGGFHVMAERHGESSAEVDAVTSITRRWVQMELPFLGELVNA